MQVGYTPLMCAALKGQAGVVRDLIKLGCSTAAVDNVNLVVTLACDPRRTEYSPLCVQDNWTALHHAASSGDVAVVRVLLEGKASRKAVNADGKTARQIAAADVRPPAWSVRFHKGWQRSAVPPQDHEAVVTLFRQWSMFEGDSDDDEPAADAEWTQRHNETPLRLPCPALWYGSGGPSGKWVALAWAYG
jgi:hypothetical protein